MDIFRRRRRNPYVLPVVVLLVAAAGGAGWYYMVGSSPSDGEAVAAVPSPNTQATPAMPETATEATPAAQVSTPEPVIAAPAGEPAAQPVQEAAVEPVGPVAAPMPAPAVAASEPTAAPAVAPAPPAGVPAVLAETPASLPSFNPGTVMADAKRLMDAGDLVGARAALNPAITSGMLPADEQKLAMQLQEQINKTLVFSARLLPNDEWTESYTLKSGDMLQRIAPKYGLTAKMIQRMNNIADPRKIRAGQTLKVIKGPFHAVVSKSGFTMDLYLGAAGGEGSMYVCTLPVGLGMDDSTPVGTWQVESGKKLVNPKYYSPRGEGVIEPDDPANPLGEFWIGLIGTGGEAVGKTSYGIHGTIEPDSIGKMASLGCIRMRHDDIALVYDMLVEGKSTVVVKP